MRADKFMALTNDVFGPTMHYITIFVLCRRVDKSQEPVVRRCSGPILKIMCDDQCLPDTGPRAGKVRSLGVEGLG